ncbi:MAG: hypothetical protein JWO31_309, partial [Phycisphaerales bacterium]|nr:hypothetical protein [Phycisphaerales bacterium]
RQLSRATADGGLDPERCPDGFRPPAGWFPEPVAPAAVIPVNAAVAAPAPTSDRAAAFRAGYRVTAVLRTGPRPDQGLAVLAGAAGGQTVTVRVGQSVGGFVLRAVHERSVTLVNGGDSVDLALPTAGLTTASVAP